MVYQYQKLMFNEYPYWDELYSETTDSNILVKCALSTNSISFSDTEEFIEDIYSINPTHSFEIDVSANLYDRVISEYDHTSNHIETPIEELPVTFKAELSWICNECDNTWKASLFGRLYKNKECIL